MLILFLGLLVGMISTIAGVGGGFFIMPYLLLIHNLEPPCAAGTSLCVIFFNSLSATAAHAKSRKINYRLGSCLALFTLPGAFTGAYIVRLINPALYQIVFGIILLIASACMFLIPASPITSQKTSRLDFYLAGFFGLISGVIASTFGIGGGIIHVPLLIYLFKISPHISTATSLFILVWTSLAACIPFLINNLVKIDLMLLLSIGVIFGSQLGVYLSGKVRSSVIKAVTATIIIIMAIEIIIKASSVAI